MPDFTGPAHPLNPPSSHVKIPIFSWASFLSHSRIRGLQRKRLQPVAYGLMISLALFQIAQSCRVGIVAPLKTRSQVTQDFRF